MKVLENTKELPRVLIYTNVINLRLIVFWFSLIVIIRLLGAGLRSGAKERADRALDFDFFCSPELHFGYLCLNEATEKGHINIWADREPLFGWD